MIGNKVQEILEKAVGSAEALTRHDCSAMDLQKLQKEKVNNGFHLITGSK